MNRYQRGCAKCIFGKVLGQSRLCEDCKRAGYRWCSGPEKHVVKASDMHHRTMCHACFRAYTLHYRMHKEARVPPKGWKRTDEIARRWHFARETVETWARAGKIRAWQARKNGWWYIDENGGHPHD
jgi:hypothetical protein